MKQIQPINIWINGETKIGVKLLVNCVFDNYESDATNLWQIYDENNLMISQSNLLISGQDYIDWGDQPAMKINEWIYNWTAQKLGLTIINN